VFSGIRRSNGVQGLRVIVQSERHPSYVDQRVEAFLAKMEVSALIVSKGSCVRFCSMSYQLTSVAVTIAWGRIIEKVTDF
jgi:hypothetical protein